jgi:hypothetical protein
MKVQDIKIYNSCVESPYIFMDNNGFIVNNIIQSVGTINNISFGGTNFFDGNSSLNNSNLSLTFQSALISSNYYFSFELFNIKNRIETSDFNPFLYKDSENKWNINSNVIYKRISSDIYAGSLDQSIGSLSVTSCSLRGFECENKIEGNFINSYYKYDLLKTYTTYDRIKDGNNWYWDVDLNDSKYSIYYIFVKWILKTETIKHMFFKKDCFIKKYPGFTNSFLDLNIIGNKDGTLKVELQSNCSQIKLLNPDDIEIKIFGALKYDISWDN